MTGSTSKSSSCSPATAEVEVSVFLEDFKNIGLFHQGWYAIELKVHTVDESQFGVPMDCVSYLEDVPLDPQTAQKISASERSYQSRTFKIRYAREKVDLQSMITFKIGLDATTDFFETPLLLSFELLYRLNDKKGSNGSGISNDNDGQDEKLPREPLRSVSKQQFRIAKPACGTHEYCMLTFDEWHLIKCNLTVHTFLLGFTSRALTPHSKSKKKESAQTNSLPVSSTSVGSSSGSQPAPLADLPSARETYVSPSKAVDLADRSTLRGPNVPAASGSDTPIFDDDSLFAQLLANKAQGITTASASKFVDEVHSASSVEEKAELLHRRLLGTQAASQAQIGNLLPPLAPINMRSSHDGALPPLQGPVPPLPALKGIGNGHSLAPASSAATSCRWHAQTVSAPLVAVPETPRGSSRGSGGTAEPMEVTLVPRLEQDASQLAGMAKRFAKSVVGEGEGEGAARVLPRLREEAEAARFKIATLWQRFLTLHKTDAPELTKLLQSRWELEREEESNPWIMGNTEGASRQLAETLGPTPPPSPEITGSPPQANTQEMRRSLDMQMERPTGPTGGANAEDGTEGLGQRSSWGGGAGASTAPVVQRSTSFGLAIGCDGCGSVNIPQASTDNLLDMDIEQQRVASHRRKLKSYCSNAAIIDMGLHMRPHVQPVLWIYDHNHLSREPEANPSELPASDPMATPPPTRFSEEAAANEMEAGAGPEQHVFVFVHGFLGNSLDLRLVRDHLCMINPNILCLLSSCNQERTYDDIRDQGRRLAKEVAGQLETWFSTTAHPRRRLGKLSFVGHSIGNLVIRSALGDPGLAPYLSYLHTFLSISGPHLGYLYSTNTLFDGGIWLLKSFKRSACLHQLSFTDASRLQDSYLYQLSQTRGLEYFQAIILVASPQDGYVPLHSSRITQAAACQRDGKRGKLFASMVRSLMAPVLANHIPVIRVDVHFCHSKVPKNLNSIVGRTAHLEFLETDAYMKLLLWKHRQYFM